MRKLLVFFFAMCVALHSAGQALPVSKMQSAMSGVIQAKAIKRGFAANDPRFGATLTSVSSFLGSVAGSTAGVIVAGAVTAPVWATVAIGAGVGAVVTVGVTLALNGVIDWLFSPNSANPTPITQIKTPGTTSNVNQITGGLTAGGAYWKTNNYYASDAMSTILAVFADNYNALYITYTAYTFYLASCGPDSATSYNCIVKRVTKSDGTTTDYSNIRASYFSSGAPRTCPGGQVSNASACVVPQTVPDTTPNNLVLSSQAAVNNLTPAELAKPLNPAVLAPFVDKVWRDAAALPGYNGLPYVASDPVTPAQVDAWRAANPSNWPTVQDFVTPQPATNSPWVLPSNPLATTQDPTVSASPSTNPAANNPLQNLGPDPGIGAPALEATPTAQQILQPLLNLFPDFRAFTVPAHQATCPKPSFSVFGSTHVMDSHCDIAEANRSALVAVMAAVWLLSAAIIVLKA